MKIEYAKNPYWADAEKTLINLTIKWAEIDDEILFTASASDIEPHGRELFALSVAGEFGDVADYIPPPTPSSGEMPVTEV
jgi:hypothetical protein